jgi:hypothetical protein
MVSVLVSLIATLRRSIAALDRQIEQAAAAHPDFAIFDFVSGSWSGTGASFVGSLLVRRGTDINPQPKSSSSAESPPSWCAAARPPGFTTAGLVRSPFVRRSRNGGPCHRLRLGSGLL